MALLGAMRGAVHTSFQVFLVIYMREILEYSNTLVGVHVALITMAGIISTPIMGNFSDKLGRRPVISFAMILMTILIFLFLVFDRGIMMTFLVGCLGLFFFSVMPIINAAAMDMVDKGSEGSGTALMFTGGSVIGSITPIFAGIINQSSWISWCCNFFRYYCSCRRSIIFNITYEKRPSRGVKGGAFL